MRAERYHCDACGWDDDTPDVRHGEAGREVPMGASARVCPDTVELDDMPTRGKDDATL